MRAVSTYAKRMLSLVAAVVVVMTSFCIFTPVQAEQVDAIPQYPFMDTNLSFEERTADLVSRLTLDEKVSQLGRHTAAVPRLGLAKYDYWNEALHGIQNGTGEGTSFPMPWAMAQTWDTEFITKVASTIADECRGHNQPAALGGRGRGLTYWCPTINLQRWALWGRTNEAYGEDPYVSGILASAFVNGMQGNPDENGGYIKTAATMKHYALNNHETKRGSTSSDVTDKDIRDYYTRVYRYVIENSDISTVMSAYNAVNGVPSSANQYLLTTLLRKTFGFTGSVVSDCGAVGNIANSHHWKPNDTGVSVPNTYLKEDGSVTNEGSVALSLVAGCDMDCGEASPSYAKGAYNQGLITEGEIERNVYNNLLLRFKLGEFDPDEMVDYRGAAYNFANVVETDEHRALAEEAASKSVVLLKNEGNLLPLDATKLENIVLVGDIIDTCWLGNYSGKPIQKNRISVLDGISDYLFTHNKNAKLHTVTKFGENGAISEADAAVIAAADVAIVFGADLHEDSSEGHDRESMTLSRNQNEIIKQVGTLNENTVLYLQVSNPVELKEFKDKVDAILFTSTGGQAQGVGAANQIFGEVNPSGKLTFTWYADEDQIPGMMQYGMSTPFGTTEEEYEFGGFTYQYFEGDVEYPFGYGLSYTTYEYSNATIDKSTVDVNGDVTVTVDVKNTGSVAGSEVVQVYVDYPDASGYPTQIKGFAKVDLNPGEKKTATIKLDPSDWYMWDATALKNVVPAGDYKIKVAASLTDVKAEKALKVTGALADKINVITVTPEGYSVAAGKTLGTAIDVTRMDDTFIAAGDMTVTYKSNNTAVATVAADGTITGVSTGVTTIEVTVKYNGDEKTTTFPVAVKASVKADAIKVNGAAVAAFDADTTAYNVEVKDGKVPTVSATAPSGVTVDVKQATAIPGAATVTLTKGTEKTVYKVNFVDYCDITAVDFPSVTLTTAQAASYKLNAKPTLVTCNNHAGTQATITYAIVADGKQTAPATLTGDTLKVTGEGVVTVSATVAYNGAEKYVTAQIIVSDKVDRDLLEDAIRVKVSGDDFDPATLEAYLAQIEIARGVFFDEDATQEEIDKAYADLMAVKEKLVDRTYVVANFPDANSTFGYNNSKSIYVDWKKIRDAENKEVVVDLTTHKSDKLELRFTATLTPSDYNTTFADAVSTGGWFKLRSRDEANRDNDPDLKVFGGTMDTNDEHNYGWAITDYIKNWGTTEVVIPLETLNADGTYGLPVVDKGIRPDGTHNTSRGKIDWSETDRFFAIINFKEDFKNTTNVNLKLENVQIIDKTLEEEQEKLNALLTDNVDVDACTDAAKVEAYNAAVAAAEEAMAGTNCLQVINAIEALEAAREALDVTITTNKEALEAALNNKVTDLDRYTPESVAEYNTRIQTAQDVLDDADATQIEINRATIALADADSVLQLIKVAPYVLTTLVADKSVEAHHLSVIGDCDLDLSEDADYTVTLRYDIKLESTHKNKPLNNDWLKGIVNGKVRVWSVAPTNDNAYDVVKMDCAKDSVMTSYSTPGTWMTVTQELPAEFVKQGKLTRVEIFMYNDTATAYLPPEGNTTEFSNDNGVKMTVRNLQVLSDKPRDNIPVDRALLNTVLAEATTVNVDRYTKESADAFTAALETATAVAADENATQKQVDDAKKLLQDAINNLKLMRDYDLTDVSVNFSQHNQTYTNLLYGTMFYTDWKVGDGLQPDNVSLGGADLSGTAANGSNALMAFKMTVKFEALRDGVDLATAWKQIGIRLRSSRISNNERAAKFYTILSQNVTLVDGAFEVVVPLADMVTENIDWADVKQLNVTCEMADGYKLTGAGTSPDMTFTLSDVRIELIDGAVVEPGDNTALNAAIADAEKIDTTGYTEDSVAAFTAALNAAKEVAANETATQAMIDSAKKALDNAIAGLTEKADDIAYGNVDGKDDVTAADALLALQAATGKVTLDETATAAADVDNTAGVSANDALLILQFATKKIDVFPVEAK